MSTQTCLPPDEGRGREEPVAGVFKPAGRITQTSQGATSSAPSATMQSSPRAGCHCNAVAGYTVPVIDSDEHRKVAVVAVIVLYQDVFIL